MTKLATMQSMVLSDETAAPRASGPTQSWGNGVGAFALRFVRNNWKVLLYLLLIVMCVLFAPEKPLKFIYTEF